MVVDIITPDKSLFSGEAVAVTVPGTDGSLGILDKHAPLISALKRGKVKVTTAGGEDFYDIAGGVVEVQQNKVIILAE
ncbi:MAG TPA: ATP synthase F1 subunit epsilon [Cryomorphaceae bacterium]|nr:ATP synthase F1 subunit epsilon [Cryomorphaceae bacterium]